MLTIQQVDGRLKTLKKAGYKKVHENVQEIAVAIVNHANDTGDCRRALVLTTCVPVQMRPLLVAWFTEVSPINVNLGKTRKDDKVSLRKPKSKHYNDFDIERAKANNWWENPFKAEGVEPDPFTIDDYYKSFSGMFDRMEKAMRNDAKRPVAAEHAEKVAALRAHMRAALIEFRRGDETERQEAEAEAFNEDTAEAVAKAA